MVELDLDAAETWIYPINFPVRDYQLNITHSALFQNTLVSLPTGLGKTLIAAVVMFNFYRWFPGGKVIFMAPTRPLVSQQRVACQQVTGIRDEECAQLEGSVPTATREVLWREKRVFFCTPQVVENDVVQGRLNCRQIICIVIDEAHRANGSYAFVNVIREISSVHREFRVLALSATPGPNQNAIQKVLLNLLISHLEWRCEDDADVVQYSHTKDVEIVKCPSSATSSNVDSMKKHIDNLITTCCHRLVQAQYLMNSQPNTINMFIIDEAERKCISRGDAKLASIVKVVRSLEKCRLLIKNGNTKELISHVTEQLSIGERMMVTNSNYHSFLSLVESIGSASTLISHSSKITKLREMLGDYFESAEQLDSRVIVFVALRNTVHQVISEISTVPAQPFIGQANSADNRGMSQKEQEAIVQMFRQGNCNVLVATSIAEEGLDIGEVDLIVCYDNVASPVRLVQRLGRTGRKRKGRVIMLVAEDKDEDKVALSSKRISAMSSNIEKMKKSLVYYRHNCRMIPEHINPRLAEKFFDTRQENVPTKLSAVPQKAINTLDKYTMRKPMVVSNNSVVADPPDDYMFDWLFDEKSAKLPLAETRPIDATAIDITPQSSVGSKISPTSVVDIDAAPPITKTCTLCDSRYKMSESSDENTCAACTAALRESLAMQAPIEAALSAANSSHDKQGKVVDDISRATDLPVASYSGHTAAVGDQLSAAYERLENALQSYSFPGRNSPERHCLSAEEQQTLLLHVLEPTSLTRTLRDYQSNARDNTLVSMTTHDEWTESGSTASDLDGAKPINCEVVGSDEKYLWVRKHGDSSTNRTYRISKNIFNFNDTVDKVDSTVCNHTTVASLPASAAIDTVSISSSCAPPADSISRLNPTISTTASIAASNVISSTLRLSSDDISPIRCSNTTIYEPNAFDISMLEENFWSEPATAVVPTSVSHKPITPITPQTEQLIKISKPIVNLVSPPLSDITQREMSRANANAHGDDDVPCGICTSRDVEEDDPGVFCDICDGFTHLDCYGLSRVPKGNFHCDSCKSPTHSACVLCFQRGGMLRQCNSGQWAHPVCGLFTPELILDDDMRIASLAIDPERSQLRCFLCSKRGGAVIQCCYASCFTAMHPYCALSHEYQLVIRFVNNVFSYEIYCNAHKFSVDMKGLFSATCDLHTDDSAGEDIEEDDGELDLIMTQKFSPHRPRKRLQKLKYSTKFSSRKRTKKNATKSAAAAKVYFEEEAVLSGSSASSDEAPEDCSQLSGSFINDGMYTQIPGRDTGMAMYHGLHRKLVGQSPLTGKFRFRGGEKGLPLTERIMKQYAQAGGDVDTSFADSAAENSYEAELWREDHDLYSF